MHFVYTCIIIILAFRFFNGSLSQKKFVKLIEDDIIKQTFRNLQGKWKVCVSYIL